jgi:capsule polysaccharide modification protein KpsS
MGTFFAKLAQYLASHGQQVLKINFNGGDRLFFRGPNATTYRGTHAEWAGWLRRFIVEHRIDAIALFGQMRPVHQPVAEIARQLGVQLFVFEEGYVRPNHVTLEIGGVNAHSPLPRDRAVYDAIPAEALPATRRPVPTGQGFWRTARRAMAYGLARSLTAWLHPNEVYHRPLNPLVESLKWVRGGLRKALHLLPDRAVMRELTAAERSGRWFLFPLQVHNDSQILRHSHYESMEQGLEQVMRSFAAHAPEDHWLVVKHHPMDRAYRHFGDSISALARELGITQRVRYVHDVHMPTVLSHTRGMVTVNSTTGLQALHHGKPVITLGECVYDIEGLVYGGTLDAFWRDPGSVDMQLFYRFRHHLIEQSQLNASFYAKVPAFEQAPAAGLVPVPRAPVPALPRSATTPQLQPAPVLAVQPRRPRAPWAMAQRALPQQRTVALRPRVDRRVRDLVH